MSDAQQLLAEYVRNDSESAFRELVNRYVDLVHSAAVRLVNGDSHLAQDVTQTVFVDLARMARSLSPDVMLGGWLHRHTCFVASKTMRGERRRQKRERQAVEMNAIEEHSTANLAVVTPVLDEAIDQLGAEDRQAILLRFFEQLDFRSVGETLGSNEDAARKRVGRALDKLHLLLSRRGVALSAAALGTVLGTHAVSAAPIGMAAGIATTALASGASISTLALIMSTTKVKVALATTLLVAVTVPYAIQHNTQTKLRQENDSLRQQAAQIDRLIAENERLAKLAAPVPAAPAPTNDQFREVLKLRGEVGRLRQENASATAAIAEPKGPSALSGVRSNPEMYKVIRDQQKMGLGMIYKDFATRVNLPKEQGEKLVDLLADHVMENVGHIETILRERKTPAERDRLLAAQEAVLQEKLQALLGPEGLSQYQEYTRNLAGHLTAEQFKNMLTGEKAVKDEQARQLFQLMQEETQRALEGAGLDRDYQAVPNLNFRNFVSEEEAEKNLKLLDDIYARVSERATSFLSPEEIKKFGEFRASAVNGNRMALTINRKMMSPTPK